MYILNGVQKGSHTKKCKLQCTASHTFPADLGMKCPSLQSTAKCCPQQAIRVGHDSMAQMGCHKHFPPTNP